MNWKQETEGLIEIIEIYFKKGGWSELPNEVINDIEGTLEEQTKEIERLNNKVEELEEKLEKEKANKKKALDYIKQNIRDIDYDTEEYDYLISLLDEGVWNMKEKEERLIQIPLEEYKELLVIKGRYEELVIKATILPNQKITYVNGNPVQEFEKEYDTYKITCNMESKSENNV